MNDSDPDAGSETVLSDSSALEATSATDDADTHGDEAYCSACGKSYALDVDICPNDGARLTKLRAQPDSLLGRIFDNRYEVRMAIGRGGMGTVYRGWQLSVDREVAIKVIHPKLATDRTAVKRFLREARLSSRLSQPSIVNVYDFGQSEDNVLYLVMELLRGHTLGRELEAMRPLPLRRVTTIATQLCDALDSAHGQGIIHRDLKPTNIVILDDPPGRDLIKVLDFGLAKSLVNDTSSVVTNTSAILGTPLYMSPEQIEGKATDQRSDLYSLGCIMHQMLSGKPPFLGDNVNIVLAMHLSEPPPALPLSVPPVLARMVRELMEKDVQKRPRSAAHVREAIRLAVEGGYATDELSDTTPDIPPTFDADGVPKRNTPIGLAMTDPALARPPLTDLQAAVASPMSSTVLPSSSQSRRWIGPAIVGVLAVGGLGAYVATRGSSSTPAVAAPADAARAIEADAATAVAAPDAGVQIDAGEVTLVDASQPSKPPKPPKPPKRPKAPRDAGAEPSLDFIKPR